MSITLTREKLSRLYTSLFDSPLPDRFLFGVRGAVPTEPGSLTIEPKPSQLDVCDDAIGFVLEDGRGHAYSGSVDPGRHYTSHPMDPAGCAHVLEGWYTFIKGRHKSEPHAWKGHNVRCWRDRDRDNVRDSTEQKIYVVEWSIDLHYGGGSNTVGEYSAGCQIVKQPGWNTFRDLTYEFFGDTTRYWLINVNQLLHADQETLIPSVVINGQAVSRGVPMWLSSEGRVVAVARALLSRLQLDGAPIGFTYSGQPKPHIILSNGAEVPGVLVHNQLVCAVGDILRGLDDADLQWDAGQQRITVDSAKYRIAPAQVAAISRLENADNDTEIVT